MLLIYVVAAGKTYTYVFFESICCISFIEIKTCKQKHKNKQIRAGKLDGTFPPTHFDRCVSYISMWDNFQNTEIILFERWVVLKMCGVLQHA